MVATARLGKRVDIEELSLRLPNAMYEPEQFPGVIYHAKGLEGVSVLIFANGKVVIAGLRSMEAIEDVEHELTRLAKQLQLVESQPR
jgi:TATA-box binding protein (TBP) (component of TFIID and TFIIIB)